MHSHGHEIVAIQPRLDPKLRIKYDSKVEVFYLEKKGICGWHAIESTIELKTARVWSMAHLMGWISERWGD